MSDVGNLASFNREEIKAFLDSFDTVLCDVDGVIININDAIFGAVEAIKTLRKLGKKVIFVTNNCLLTVKDYHERFRNLGFGPGEGEVINPGSVITDFFKKRNFQKKIFMFTIHGLKKELEDAGFDVLDAHDVKIEGKDPLNLHLDMVKLDPEVGAVYLDIDVAFNYVALQQAVQYLKNPDVLLCGSGRNKMLTASKTLTLMGPGFFMEIIEEMTGREAILFGKPGTYMNDFIRQNVTEPSRTLFVGDSMEQDINFANKYGYKSLLVFTGTSTKSHLESCENRDNMPTYYIQDLDTLRLLIEKYKL